MDKNLASLLVIEGQATDEGDLNVRLKQAGLDEYSIDCGCSAAMVAVVRHYKPAAALRQLDEQGMNTSVASVHRFQFCSRLLMDMVSRVGNSVVKALIVHNAASCMSISNGCMPRAQRGLNNSALSILDSVARGPGYEHGEVNWTIVWAKVSAGLYEAGHMDMHEMSYMAVTDMMEVVQSKDTAGRRLFLAKWLMSQGRQYDAIKALEPVEAEGYVSAPNQISAALGYLAELRGTGA